MTPRVVAVVCLHCLHSAGSVTVERIPFVALPVHTRAIDPGDEDWQDGAEVYPPECPGSRQPVGWMS